MEFIKCFMCCNLLNENSCQINEEIEELYLELTSLALLEEDKRFRVCSECLSKLRDCVTFKKNTISNRAQFYEEILNVEQKVKVEVFPEDYIIVEARAPSPSRAELEELAELEALDEGKITRILPEVPLSRRNKFCITCHHQINKQDPPEKGVMYCCCPSCGLTVPNWLAKGFGCRFCKRFSTLKLSILRTHFVMKHGFSSIVKCDQCRLYFFSESALKKHKEVCHLLTKKKCLESERLSIPTFAEVSTNQPTVARVQTKPKITVAKDRSDKLKTVENNVDETAVAVDSSDEFTDSSDETTVALATTDKISSPPQISIRNCGLCQVSSDVELSMDLKSQTLTPCLLCGKNIKRCLRAQCTICGLTQKMKSLEKHYSIYHKDQKFVRCSEGCDQVFLSESAKNQHHSYHILKCKCNETFKNIRAYKMHQRDCDNQCTDEVVQVIVAEADNEPPLKILRMSEGSKIFACVPTKMSFYKKDPISLAGGTKLSEEQIESDPLEISEIKTENIQNKVIELLNVTGKPTGSVPLEKSAEIDPLLTTDEVPSITIDLSNQAIEPSGSVEAVKPVKNLSKSVNGKKSKNVPNDSHDLKNLDPSPKGNKTAEPSAKENKTTEPCSVCDSQGNKKERIPPGDRKTTCPKCKRTVKYSENLRMKMEKFKCSLCQFKTFDNVEIRKHIEVQHSRSKIIFQCNLCQQTLESEEVLKEHSLKSHSFFCSICTSKKFLRKEALDEHMKKHQKADVTWESEGSLFDLIEIN